MGDLALCDRHVGEWVGLMNVPRLQLGISDPSLMAASEGACDEVELRASCKFADPASGIPAMTEFESLPGATCRS